MPIIQERAALRIVDGFGRFITLPNLKLDKMTTNTNGYETLTFSFLMPPVSDQLPITPKNWVGMVCPFIGGQFHGEFFVDEISGPISASPDDLIEYKVTCYGMQHIVKTTMPSATKNFTTATAPEVICQDAVLEGPVATALAINQSTQTFADATGITIKQKIDVTKNRSVGDWWLEVLTHGDGTVMWGWEVWANPHYGLRPNALCTEIHFRKRDFTTVAYYVNLSDLKDGTTIVQSFNQYWDNASFHYTGASNSDNIVTATAPTGSLPNFTCIRPDGTTVPLTHTYIGELGLAGGDITQTVSTTQAQQRANAQYNGELSYRLSGSPFTILPDSVYDANGVRVPNETMRAGNVIRIRNNSLLRNQGKFIDFYITQTSLDLTTGEISLTPLNATDYHTLWSYFFKKKGSHRHHKAINPNFQ